MKNHQDSDQMVKQANPFTAINNWSRRQRRNFGSAVSDIWNYSKPSDLWGEIQKQSDRQRHWNPAAMYFRGLERNIQAGKNIPHLSTGEYLKEIAKGSGESALGVATIGGGGAALGAGRAAMAGRSAAIGAARTAPNFVRAAGPLTNTISRTASRLGKTRGAQLASGAVKATVDAAFNPAALLHAGRWSSPKMVSALSRLPKPVQAIASRAHNALGIADPKLWSQIIRSPLKTGVDLAKSTAVLAGTAPFSGHALSSLAFGRTPDVAYDANGNPYTPSWWDATKYKLQNIGAYSTVRSPIGSLIAPTLFNSAVQPVQRLRNNITRTSGFDSRYLPDLSQNPAFANLTQDEQDVYQQLRPQWTTNVDGRTSFTYDPSNPKLDSFLDIQQGINARMNRQK